MDQDNRKPTPDEVKNFPKGLKRVYVEKKKGLLYVTQNIFLEPGPDGKKRSTSINLGRIVDNVFYTMDEYHQKFKRSGKKREPDQARLKNRTYVRRKPKEDAKPKPAPRYAPNLPDKTQVENFPHDIEGARIINTTSGIGFYVVTTTYYRANGNNLHVHKYLGRIMDNRFYTMEEYRRTFKKNGTRRDAEESE